MPNLTRFRRVILAVTVLLASLAGWARYHYFSKPTPLDPTRLESYSAKELINGLQDEASEGLGTHSTAWADGFLASDEAPTFRGGILGSEKPAVSPVMRELVRRGVAVLPDLLEHLEDARPTKLVVKLPFGGFGGMWHSDEYEYRFDDERRQPAGVNSRGGLDDMRMTNGEYPVRVGDLCYVVIGQIVNRRMNVVRYQPTACIVINSPVETPSLAAAVRADWGGLNIEQHEKSLIEDAEYKGPFAEYALAAALARLRFYYPATAARIEAKAKKQVEPPGK
jgi:hypothetical protein